jgi:hypothetical protein
MLEVWPGKEKPIRRAAAPVAAKCSGRHQRGGAPLEVERWQG